MRRRASVTVVFSLVFVLVFSFILSLFELAAYTARASYHAAAGCLATENYFAAFLEPLYEQYHIFAREVPEGEELIAWTQACIAEDITYMTKKREDEKSLLLRAGAEFSVTSATVLSAYTATGFYSQAVAAMKYRGVLEVVALLQEMAGMTKQVNANLEVAAAKTATDSAYGLVDEKILKLMELVDGIDIVQYGDFLRGKNTYFQKDVYAKFFCTDREGSANYFDRTEVYQAFLRNSENPLETLENLISKAKALEAAMKLREEEEGACEQRAREISRTVTQMEAEKIWRKNDREKYMTELGMVQAELGTLRSEKEEEVKKLLEEKQEREAELVKKLEELDMQEEQEDALVMELSAEQFELKLKLASLEQEKREQEREAGDLRKEEERFLQRCSFVAEACSEACVCAEEIRRELESAKKVKETCETVLHSVETIVGAETAAEYQKELKKFEFYESAKGYDFDRMQQTLSGNKGLLDGMKLQLCGTDRAALLAATDGLLKEKERLAAYSFEGLKLNYGEMSLEENIYDGVEGVVSSKVAEGFLGFLTTDEISEKSLEVSYLPSGFRYTGASFDIFSLLGTDMSSIFEKLGKMLPQESSIGSIVDGVSDAVLFHSYLMTHFPSYIEKSEGGALSYGQEYLIAGKKTDKENLSSVAMRLLAIRTVVHFISLYADGKRKAPVEQAALAACGLIGLPALKSLVVFLLLFVWAVEEAMVDTAALLQGTRLSLYPGKSGGSLSFPEMLLFSKTFVAQKAAQKRDAKGVAFGYKEYIHFFLFVTPKEDKCFRALDLIQENLRLSYQTSFRVKRCVWKVGYEVDGRHYEYAYEN